MEGLKRPLHIILLLTFVPSLIFSKNQQIGNTPPLYRLLENVIPVSYDLSLTIDPQNVDFTGIVNITFNIVEENHDMNYFYLHADIEYIIINSIVLNDNIDCSIFGITEAEILCIICSESVSGHENNLIIRYTAKFSTEDGYGMIKSTYLDQGEEQTLIESSFKPTYARRAFPCMDEPDLRANFSISVTYPSEYSVISNTPVLDEYDAASNFQTTVFTTTPKISSYLVSIFLSKFQTASTARSEDDIQFKVFTRSEVSHLTNTVVGNYYSKVIAELNDYTGVPYESLNDAECYHVAIPDYSDGMDSFGLFTYRETEILDEGDKTTNRATQNIITTMAYKLSHEWYGDSLTTKWWSDVWANEAVATYLKYIIPNQVNPEFDLVNQFVVEVIQKAMLYDGMPFAQPLSSKETDVNDVRDIENKLDTFSILKGASIIHTLSVVLGGDENFKSALQRHWNRRNSLDTDGYDLLMDLALTKDGHWYNYFDAWGYAAGYSIMHLHAYPFGGTENTMNITTKRFVYPVENMTDYENVYMIPITQTSEGYDFSIVFYENFLDPNGRSNNFYYGRYAWVIFNIQVTGFYRVNYDEELWRRIIDRGLKNADQRPQIHVLNSLDDYNLRKLIFCTGIRHSENIAEDWDFLWNLYHTSSSVHERDDILNALGCAENLDILNSYLLKTITPNSGIKKQDALVVFKSIFSSSVGIEAAMEFLEYNFANIVSFYRGMHIISEMLYAMAEKLITDEDVSWLESLLLDNIFNDYEDIRTKANVLASVNNYWRKHYQGQVLDLFPSTSTATSTTTSTAAPRTTSIATTATPDNSNTDSPISTTTDSSCRRILATTFCLILCIALSINI